MQVYALERVSTLSVYEGVFSALTKRTPIYVYTKDKEYQDVFKYSKKIILTQRLEKADIAFITQKSTLEEVLKEMKKNKKLKILKLFVSKYRLLKYSDEVLGASYWRKGRSQLLFIKSRLEKHFIKLPKTYHNFTVDEL